MKFGEGMLSELKEIADVLAATATSSVSEAQADSAIENLFNILTNVLEHAKTGCQICEAAVSLGHSFDTVLNAVTRDNPEATIATLHLFTGALIHCAVEHCRIEAEAQSHERRLVEAIANKRQKGELPS